MDVEVVVEEHDEEDVELTGLGREPAKKPKTTIVRSKKTMTATVRPLEAIASGYARR